MAIRVTEAAKILGVSPITVRRWCNDGKLEYSLSAAGQRVFDREYLESLRDKANGIEVEPDTIFYVRSSSKNDVLTETQLTKLAQKFGEPDFTFSDNASGLNENRKGLNKLINHVIEASNPVVVYVTNKDRLTRFGFKYIERLLNSRNCEIVVLDSDNTKEPLEVLMQDFMSLLASFSGKYYRLRGWEQRKKFLKDVNEEVDKHV